MKSDITAQITDISLYGDVTIHFSKPLYIFKNLSMMTDTDALQFRIWNSYNSIKNIN